MTQLRWGGVRLCQTQPFPMCLPGPAWPVPILSPEPAHQVQPGRGGTVSLPQAPVGSLQTPLCSRAAAGSLPLPKGEAMLAVEGRRELSQGSQMVKGAPGRGPSPTGRWWHISTDIHVMSSQRKSQKFPCLLYTVCSLLTQPPPASYQVTWPGGEGRREGGASPFYGWF